MDEDECEYVELEPEGWSWRACIASGLGVVSVVFSSLASFVDDAQLQFAAGYLLERQQTKKAEAEAEARKMLTRLNGLD